MVKGVNKSVIEISDTGSKFFNKAILFVSPEYSSVSSKKLKSEAKKTILNIRLAGADGNLTLRELNNKKIKRKKFFLIVGGLLLIGASVITILIF